MYGYVGLGSTLPDIFRPDVLYPDVLRPGHFEAQMLCIPNIMYDEHSVSDFLFPDIMYPNIMWVYFTYCT
jgi:hypothetical protein